MLVAGCVALRLRVRIAVCFAIVGVLVGAFFYLCELEQRCFGLFSSLGIQLQANIWFLDGGFLGAHSLGKWITLHGQVARPRAGFLRVELGELAGSWRLLNSKKRSILTIEL